MPYSENCRFLAVDVTTLWRDRLTEMSTLLILIINIKMNDNIKINNRSKFNITIKINVKVKLILKLDLVLRLQLV